ncbi:MAG TPA: TetR/AcrR family transcriptional regulator [Pseudonocardiaceae bacterium]
MPKVWTETIETHRAAVRHAILDAAWALVTAHGLTAVTMSRIAEQAGIGRATLYKYFPDVRTILLAWHEQQVAGHLEQLTALRDRPGSPAERLAAVLGAYARMAHHRRHHGPDLATLLHQGHQAAGAHQQLHTLIRDLLTEVAATGDLRTDVPPHELATYCVHALGAATTLPTPAAVRRLVTVTLAGLRPTPT